jgi:hypothetical protein
MKTALDLLHGVRVELADHGNLSIPSPLRHQYLDFVFLKPAPVQKMKRRRSRRASPSSCPCVVAGTAKNRPRAGAAAAGRLDSDEGAQGDAVLDMADLEEELSQIDPYTTMPAHTPKGHHLRVPR